MATSRQLTTGRPTLPPRALTRHVPLHAGAHALRAAAATNALDHDADIAKVQEWWAREYRGHPNL